MTGQQQAKSLGSSCWPTKTLADCIEKVKVPAKIPRTSFLEEGSLPIISQEADFINGYWNDEADAVRVSEPVVVFGDHTQVLKLVDFDFVVGADGVKILKPKQFLDARFLRFYLEANPFPSLGYARHYRHISPLEVPLPPLNEQKRIVAILDQAFAALGRARAHAEANLADAEHMADIFLDEQVVSLIDEFGRIRIGALAEVKGGKRLPKGEKPGIEKTAYPYITVRDMNDAGTISSEKVGFISEAAQRTIQRYTISSADIYISIAGTIGKTGVVPERLNGANLTENAAKLVLLKGWLRDFVYWSTRSSNFRAQMIDQTRTAAQPKLALQRLSAITIPNADQQSQRRIVENMVRFHDGVGALKSAYEAKLADISTLRQSLLQKAFSGELT